MFARASSRPVRRTGRGVRNRTGLIAVWVGGAAVLSIVAWAEGPVMAGGPLTRTQMVSQLSRAYPATVMVDAGGALLVRGREVLVAELRTAGSVEARMANATIGDQFSIPYPPGCPVQPPMNDLDPGRLRNEAFFRAMYGGSRSEVAKNLVPVKWFGSTLQATTINGVDKRLAAVASELALFPELRRYLVNPGGGFNWRKIAGEKILSMHSFGIAFDVNVTYSDYWRWSDGVKEYANRIPCAIGDVFERHGFIWGAKWFHFDTMHFEYRPELL